jgi:hypothetical protein
MQHSTSTAAVTIHGARLHLVELISIKAFWYPDATETELLALYGACRLMWLTVACFTASFLATLSLCLV